MVEEIGGDDGVAATTAAIGGVRSGNVSFVGRMFVSARVVQALGCYNVLRRVLRLSRSSVTKDITGRCIGFALNER